MAQGSTRRSAALSRVRDPKRLLANENPDSQDPTEVRHYLRIYSELVNFNRGLLERADQRRDRMSEDAQQELSLTDLPALQEQKAFLERRLRFWQDRFIDLAGLDLDEDRLILHHNGQSSQLTQREFELLTYLVKLPGQFRLARDISRHAWGNGQLADEQVRTYVARLRGKLATLAVPLRLVSRRTTGYAIEFYAAAAGVS